VSTTPPTGSGKAAPANADGAEALNRDCLCVTVDHESLRRELDHDSRDADLYHEILTSRPHLFSDTAVFVTHEQTACMRAVIAAIETVVALPAYREHVLDWAPASARVDAGPHGVFMGYDFHLGSSGPQLIEINTNAGGALLNAALARAQLACCEKTRPLMSGPMVRDETFVDMFRREWRLARGDAPLTSIAIVDGTPTEQYLYPEFVLFERLFQRHGIRTVIADPAELMMCHGRLWHEELKIDLVYNRLTDFALEDPRHATLREIWRMGGVVLTPHPRAHALYADKRNLAALTDEALLRRWQVPDAVIHTLLTGIPHTVSVNATNAGALWEQRDELFFKPAAGYGAKAAYRGDKITTRVWKEITAGNYVAQKRIAPSERWRRREGAETALKFDIRNYVYDGEVQLLAARLYQGQTTNFRTPGGGFAPVFSTP
jgi:hypothetical protein